jgi:anaerobic C4-dicarboxylate transporter DcuA
MILAVITALSLLEAAGGLDLVVRFAETVLRGNPRRVTFLAPLVTYLLVLASGTQHVIYALLPVIAEVARTAGIRPERPLSMSVIASQQGLIASPVSAVSAALVVTLSGTLGLPQLLLVVVPATLAGLAAGTLSVAFRGKELADDPVYQERLAQGKVTEPVAKPALDPALRRPSAIACAVFALAILAVVLIGIFPGLRPIYEQAGEGVTETGQVEMGRATMIVMLAAAGLLLLFARADPEKAIKGSVMKGGLTAIISILGVSWMGSSFFEGNRAGIVGAISSTVEAHPWVFAVGLFVLSLLLFSQAAAIAILGPVAIAIGLPAPLVVGAYPAVNGNFFLPTYGTVLAAVSFDQTGTTRIGRYLLNHSFMLPGLVATTTSTLVALGLARWLL